MDSTTRLLATALSTAIAAGLMAIWRRRKERGFAVDAATGSDANSKKYRRIETAFIAAVLIVGVSSFFVTREMLRPSVESRQAEKDRARAAATAQAKALYGDNVVVVMTPTRE